MHAASRFTSLQLLDFTFWRILGEVAERMFCEVVDDNGLRRLRSLPRSRRDATPPCGLAVVGAHDIG